jgi:hypothetical protein
MRIAEPGQYGGLIEMQAQRAALTAERDRVEAAMGPVQYLAVMVGTDSETAVR